MTPAQGSTGLGHSQPFPLSARYPNLATFFVCVGAQKAATTWLAKALAQHRDCYVPHVKEMHYWSIVDLSIEREEHLLQRRAKIRKAANGVAGCLVRPHRLRDALWQLRQARMAYDTVRDPSVDHYITRMMRGYRGEPVAGELTPNYSHVSSKTLSQMAELHPNTKFIFVMRDPVARLWSGIRHRFRIDPRSSDVVDERIQKAFRRAVAKGSASGDFVKSDYRKTIAALDEAVGRNDVLYLFHETVRSHAELARLAAFLGLGTLDAEPERRANPGVRADLQPDPAALASARKALEPVYQYVQERFAEHVPAAWHDGTALSGKAISDGTGRGAVSGADQSAGRRRLRDLDDDREMAGHVRN